MLNRSFDMGEASSDLLQPGYVTLSEDPEAQVNGACVACDDAASVDLHNDCDAAASVVNPASSLGGRHRVRDRVTSRTQRLTFPVTEDATLTAPRHAAGTRLPKRRNLSHASLPAV